MNNSVKKYIRSPNIFEMMICFCTIHILCILTIILYFEKTFIDYLFGLLMGSFVYTFLEYVFHRFILHKGPKYMIIAHKNHHSKPTNLKIITTPLIPIIIYDLLLVTLLLCIFDSYFILLLQTGISFSQLTMDMTHVYIHSKNMPQLLSYQKSYHLLHHKHKNHDYGFGLTTSFWDMIFGTLPSENNRSYKIWDVYSRKKWLIYFSQIPLPLVGFVMIYFIQYCSEKNVVQFQVENKNKVIFPKIYNYKNIIISLTLSIFVGLYPLLTNMIFQK